MGLIDKLKYNFINLDVLQKIILIMIVFFVIPYLINTILFQEMMGVELMKKKKNYGVRLDLILIIFHIGIKK